MAERLGEYLVQAGIITERQLATVLERQVMMGGRLGTNLIELGYVSEEELVQFLSQKLHIPSAQPQDFEGISPDVIRLIPVHLAQKHGSIPLRQEKKSIKMAMVNPLDLEAIDELRFASGHEIRPCLCTEARVQYALEQYYKVARGMRYVSILPDERRAKKNQGAEETPRPALQDSGQAEARQHQLDLAFEQLKQQLVSVTDREEVIEFLLWFFTDFLDRAVFLVLRDGQLLGWSGRVPGMDPAEIRKIQVPLSDPSLFRDAVERKESLVGDQPIPGMGGSESGMQSVLIPLVVDGMVIGMIYADNALRHVAIPSSDLLSKVMAKAAMALKILILRNKILKL